MSPDSVAVLFFAAAGNRASPNDFAAFEKSRGKLVSGVNKKFLGCSSSICATAQSW